MSNTNYVKYLIELSQKGRKNSYLELCEFNLSSVYALALRISASKSIAKKITVKIFLAAWKNISHFREELPYGDWLKAIAVYSILEEVRSGNLEKMEKENNKNDKPVSEYLLDNLVFGLSVKERIIFVLHELEGYSPQEISDFLGDVTQEGINHKIADIRKYFVKELTK